MVDSDEDGEGDDDSEDDGGGSNAKVAQIAAQRARLGAAARAVPAQRFAIVLPPHAGGGSATGVAARSGGNPVSGAPGTVDVHQRLGAVERDLLEAASVIGRAVQGIEALRRGMSQAAVSGEEERRKASKGKGKAK